MSSNPTASKDVTRSERTAVLGEKPQLGRYVLGELLGKGGMGAVYLGEDTSLHRQVAVKVLNVAGTLDEQLRARFEREARSMARLSSRNVVAVHDFGFHEHQPYLVMELIRGVSLREWL